jgi:V8-like Glu-specific endopeptidase
MRPRLALTSVLVVVTLLTFAAPVFAGRGSGAAAERARILSYWTPARIAAATPRDVVFDAVRGFHLSKAVPRAKPSPGGGTVTGASWPNGKGKIYVASGRVVFTMDGSDWICSGSVVTDARSGFSIVLTAAHCAYDETAGGALNGFATNWMYIPQFDSNPTYTCGNTAYGCWTAQALVVHSGFATAGSFNTEATVHDWAFAVVGPGGKSGSASLEALGTFGLSTNAVSNNTTVGAFGYPAAGKYHGKDLTYCAGPVGRDPLNDDLTYRLACDMTGGSSGGPWLAPFDGSGDAGQLSSVNSYGYSGIRAMHGPVFNSQTAQTFSTAQSSGTSSNTIVN